MNLSSGELTLRFLRASGFSAPVLVYAGASIHATEYVLRFSRSGSTSRQCICLGFILELGSGISDRVPQCEGFNK